MKKILILLTLCSVFALPGCYDGRYTKEILEASGFTEVEITGLIPGACPTGNLLGIGFTAIDDGGKQITGVVCGNEDTGFTIDYE